ncbi:hypothetical protein LMH87_010331 [Akanthomyces muscarius]|uniref:Uncharacterized protein n=1 Tax=Akanthomyces muscarius TaxID=2231603 RepID=A0A9W8QFA8_AKAMU|nr:hypothetical protein LMH87_010331 [Akanthomyces muscarius]KAJ4153863.1 hypothetical protein LMH87_010331 [Akanthomyces muscarius]
MDAGQTKPGPANLAFDVDAREGDDLQRTGRRRRQIVRPPPPLTPDGVHILHNLDWFPSMMGAVRLWCCGAKLSGFVSCETLLK